MQYLKTYESYSSGDTYYIIMTKDDKYYINFASNYHMMILPIEKLNIKRVNSISLSTSLFDDKKTLKDYISNSYHNGVFRDKDGIDNYTEDSRMYQTYPEEIENSDEAKFTPKEELHDFITKELKIEKVFVGLTIGDDLDL